MKKNVARFLFLTAIVGTGLHAFNRFVNKTACMKELLSYDIGDYYDWKHGKIYYTKSGQGSPLLLIHDLHPASSSYEWKKMMHKLEKNHTVYTIDLLGCGRSEKPYLTYTNYLYVQLITDFIKDVIEQKTDVIATGSSASFTIMACNMEKQLFKKLILINPDDLNSLKKNPNKKTNIAKLLLELPIIGTFLYNMNVHEMKIHELFRDKYYSKEQLIPAKTKDAYFESAHINDGAGKYLYASMISNYTNISVTHALANIENQIHIIAGRKRAHSLDIANAYKKCNKNIEVTFISNVNMLPQMELPEKLNEVLKAII